MLLCGAVPLSQEELMADDSQTLVESRLERKQLLEEFPNYELSAVHSETTGLAPSQGPEVILSAYQTRSTNPIIESLNAAEIFAEDVGSNNILYVSHPLSKIWEERQIKPPPSDPSHWRSILDVIHGEHDTCTYQTPYLVQATHIYRYR
jgi:hypothetical protein